MLQKAKNYFFTIRHLKPVQIWYRIKRKFTTPKYKVYSGAKERLPASCWINASFGYPRISGGSFLFLNKEGHSIASENKWNDDSQDKLWLYNLHYFDDLCADDSISRQSSHRALFDNWIRNNLPGEGNGWEPYPLSLRIVNWIKWFRNGVFPKQEWLDSLACQAHWLNQDLEFFILGNHLFANAKALVFAGDYLDVPEASEWLNKGLSILEKEVSEQILSDGENFELSPMYHGIILADLLDLINLGQSSTNSSFSNYLPGWRATASVMLGWFDKMCHPDGDVSFFNDAAFGIALNRERLFSYAEKLGIKASLRGKVSKNHFGAAYLFSDSGYVVVEDEEYKAILDCACVGPDYLPGHAHADTLSFELSLFGQRLLVNSGTSCYGISAKRLRQRGTSYHNTVVVDGKNSSEVWGGFRVARRAYPSGVAVDSFEDRLSIRCSHNGYLRLVGKVIHSREWVFRKKRIQIIDCLDGIWKDAKAYFHFHPDVVVNELDDEIVLEFGCGKQVSFYSGGEISVERSQWFPEFGKEVGNTRVVVAFHESTVCTELIWD